MSLLLTVQRQRSHPQRGGDHHPTKTLEGKEPQRFGKELERLPQGPAHRMQWWLSPGDHSDTDATTWRVPGLEEGKAPTWPAQAIASVRLKLQPACSVPGENRDLSLRGCALLPTQGRAQVGTQQTLYK